MTILDIEDILEFAAALPAVLSSVDCPLVLPAMAPFGTDGTALIDCESTSPTHGVRWGGACFWDGRTPHCMLPLDVLSARPPRRLYVNAREEFDFIYDAARLSRIAREHRQTRRALRDGLRVTYGRLDPEQMLTIYDAWAAHCGDRDHTRFLADWRSTLGRILRHALTQPSVVERTRCLILQTRIGAVVGAQWVWIDTVQSTIHAPIRYLEPAYRFASRLLLAAVADTGLLAGCRLVNDGDALGSIGMFHFKTSLEPTMLRAYGDALPTSALEEMP